MTSPHPGSHTESSDPLTRSQAPGWVVPCQRSDGIYRMSHLAAGIAHRYDKPPSAGAVDSVELPESIVERRLAGLREDSGAL
jgi:hypothetical protein